MFANSRAMSIMNNPNRKKASGSIGSRYAGYREYTIDELFEAVSLVDNSVADCRRQSSTVLSNLNLLIDLIDIFKEE